MKLTRPRKYERKDNVRSRLTLLVTLVLVLVVLSTHCTFTDVVDTQCDDFLPRNNSIPDYCTKQDDTARRFINSIYSSNAARYQSFCNHSIRIGPDGDGGKIVCLDNISSKGCIIYSLGSHLDFEFEISSIKQLDCTVYTFDCTVGEVKESDIPDGVHFHPWCVGGKSERKIIQSDFGHTGEIGQYYSIQDIMTKLGHTRIDLLKMDIERHEIAVIHGFKGQYTPEQIIFETHLHNAYGLWKRPMTHEEWGSMWKKLAQLRYGIFSFEPNPSCLCCCEWSLKM